MLKKVSILKLYMTIKRYELSDNLGPRDQLRMKIAPKLL